MKFVFYLSTFEMTKCFSFPLFRDEQPLFAVIDLFRNADNLVSHDPYRTWPSNLRVDVSYFLENKVKIKENGDVCTRATGLPIKGT